MNENIEKNNQKREENIRKSYGLFLQPKYNNRIIREK